MFALPSPPLIFVSPHIRVTSHCVWYACRWSPFDVTKSSMHLFQSLIVVVVVVSFWEINNLYNISLLPHKFSTKTTARLPLFVHTYSYVHTCNMTLQSKIRQHQCNTFATAHKRVQHNKVRDFWRSALCQCVCVCATITHLSRCNRNIRPGPKRGRQS